MATDQTIIETPASRSNKRVLEAKAQRRLEKAAYSPVEKMVIIKKLRDNGRLLKSAKIVKRGAVDSAT